MKNAFKNEKALARMTVLLYLIYGTAVYYLHSMQLIPDSGYGSDSLSHIMLTQKGTVYSLNNCFLTLFYTTGGAWIGGLYLAALDIGGALAAALLIHRMTHLESKPLCLMLGLTCCIECPILIPAIGETFYTGTLGGTCYHNSTYAAMRMMAFLTLYFCFDLYEQRHSKIQWRTWLAAMLCLTMTTNNKPNFVLAFAPVLLLMLIFDFVRTRGHNFWNEFFIGCMVLPSIAFCYLQTNVLFVEQEKSIAIDPFLELGIWWDMGQTGFLICTLRSLAFPLLVLLFYGIKRRREPLVWYPWLVFVFSYGITIFLADIGRLGHLNFLWGTLFYTLLLFVSAIAVLLTEPAEEKRKHKNIVCWFVFAWHVLSGSLFLFSLLLALDLAI